MPDGDEALLPGLPVRAEEAVDGGFAKDLRIVAQPAAGIRLAIGILNP